MSILCEDDSSNAGLLLEDTSDAWEENDPETRNADTTVWQHMLAGSFAGVAEHVCVYPIDTLKTHLQTRRNKKPSVTLKNQQPSSAVATAQNLVQLRGISFLWRGVNVMMFGVVPGHALMFASYEGVIYAGGTGAGENASSERVALTGLAAGAVSTLFHDSVMVPAETIKQRMQLGYYRDGSHAIRRMLATGGGSLYRALPITLAMNAPYSAFMMCCNESLRRRLNPTGEFSLATYLTAGAISGIVAGGVTTPLDVIKTRLQTQGLRHRTSTPTDSLGKSPKNFTVKYEGFMNTVTAIAKKEGLAAFWRGAGLRMLMMGPSCALSWGAYETAKRTISLNFTT